MFTLSIILDEDIRNDLWVPSYSAGLNDGKIIMFSASANHVEEPLYFFKEPPKDILDSFSCRYNTPPGWLCLHDDWNNEVILLRHIPDTRYKFWLSEQMERDLREEIYGTTALKSLYDEKHQETNPIVKLKLKQKTKDEKKQLSDRLWYKHKRYTKWNFD